MKLLPIAFIFFIAGCATKSHPLIGSWRYCERDGSYSEYLYTDNYVFYSTEIIWEPIANKIEITGDTLYAPFIDQIITFKIEEVSNDSLILDGDPTMLLVRLTEEIPRIDSVDLEGWLSKYKSDFTRRASNFTDCPDIRTEDEKNPDIGVIGDDFEDIIN